MKENYKIDVNLLNRIDKNLLKEKDTFLSSLNSFSNSYLSSCSNSSIATMNNKLNKKYSAIEKGIDSIEKWIVDYSNDAKNIESALSNNVVAFAAEGLGNLIETIREKSATIIPDSSKMIESLKDGNKEKLPLIIDLNNPKETEGEKLPIIIDPNNPDTDSHVELYGGGESNNNLKEYEDIFDKSLGKLQEEIEKQLKDGNKQKLPLIIDLNNPKEPEGEKLPLIIDPNNPDTDSHVELYGGGESNNNLKEYEDIFDKSLGKLQEEIEKQLKDGNKQKLPLIIDLNNPKEPEGEKLPLIIDPNNPDTDSHVELYSLKYDNNVNDLVYHPEQDTHEINDMVYIKGRDDIKDGITFYTDNNEQTGKSTTRKVSGYKEPVDKELVQPSTFNKTLINSFMIALEKYDEADLEIAEKGLNDIITQLRGHLSDESIVNLYYLKALYDTNKDLKAKLEQAEKDYNVAKAKSTSRIPKSDDGSVQPIEEISLDDYKAKIDTLKAQITENAYMIKEIEKSCYLDAYYNDVGSTVIYNNYLNDYVDGKAYAVVNYDDIDKSIADANGDVLLIYESALKDGKMTEEQLKDIGVTKKVGPEDYKISVFDFYKYTDDSQKAMYHFLYKTYGSDEANQYASYLLDDINKMIGTQKAEEYLSGLDWNDEEKLKSSLANILDVSLSGLSDGIDNFMNNVSNIVDDNRLLSSDEYKTMIIMSVLSEKSDYLDKIYGITSSLGNMIPSLGASILGTVLLGPAGGLIGSALMGTAVYGSAKHYALVNGSTKENAILYGLISGASELLLDSVIGKALGLGPGSSGIFTSIIKEGAEEYLQEWVDAGARAVVLGEEIDLSDVGEDAINSFVYGVIISIGMTGGKAALNAGSKVVKYVQNGIHKEISIDELEESFIAATPGTVTYINGEESSTGDLIRDHLFKSGLSYHYNYDTLVNIIKSEPERIKEIMRGLGYSDQNIQAWFNSKSLEDIALELDKKGIAMNLSKAGYTQDSIDAYLKFYEPKSKYTYELVPNISEKLRLGLMAGAYSEYTTTIDGVKFVSYSKEGLKELTDYYEKVKKTDNDIMSDILRSKTSNKELIITNIDLSNSYCGSNGIVNITPEVILTEQYNVLSHELGHYNDFANGTSNKYDITKELNEKYPNVTKNSNKFKNDFESVKDNVTMQFDTPKWKKDIEEKADSVLIKKYGNNYDKDKVQGERNSLINSIRTAYISKYLRQEGYIAISDIYSALGVEEVHGHSKDYWDTSEKSGDVEIIANLTDLYRHGNFDKLYEYFDADVVDYWKEIVEYNLKTN